MMPFSSYYSNMLTIKPEDPGMEFLAPVVERLKVIYAEREQVLVAVREAMKPCVTVNQLAKVWPKALDYFPSEIQARVNYRPAKAKRERAKVVEKELDENVRATLLKAELLAK